LQIFGWAGPGFAPEQMLKVGSREPYRSGQLSNRELSLRVALDNIQSPLDPWVQQLAGLDFHVWTPLPARTLWRRRLFATCESRFAGSPLPAAELIWNQRVRGLEVYYPTYV
jgi:hypothetical protein